MKLICKNNLSEIYDVGDKYLCKSLTAGKEDKTVSKSDWLAYPLALCLKWDFEPIDKEYLNNLSEQLNKNMNN